jgi:hypothetical protein
VTASPVRVELLERGVEIVAEGERDIGVACTTRAIPLIGATAIMVPRISRAVASASRAAPTVHW